MGGQIDIISVKFRSKAEKAGFQQGQKITDLEVENKRPDPAWIYIPNTGGSGVGYRHATAQGCSGKVMCWSICCSQETLSGQRFSLVRRKKISSKLVSRLRAARHAKADRRKV